MWDNIKGSIKDTGNEMFSDMSRFARYMNKGDDKIREGGFFNVLKGIGWVMAGVVAMAAAIPMIAFDLLYSTPKLLGALYCGYNEWRLNQRADDDTLRAMKEAKKNPGAKGSTPVTGKNSKKHKSNVFDQDFAFIAGTSFVAGFSGLVLGICAVVIIPFNPPLGLILLSASIPLLAYAFEGATRLLGNHTEDGEIRYGNYHIERKTNDKGETYDEIHYEEDSLYSDGWDHILTTNPLTN